MSIVENQKIEQPALSEPRTYISRKTLFYIGYIIALLIIAAAALEVDPIFIIGGVIGVTCLVLVVKYPFFGLLLYMVVYFLRPGERFPALAPIRVELILGALLLLVLIIADAVRGRGIRFPRDKVTIALLMFIGALSLSFIFSEWYSHSFEVIFAFLKTFIMYYFIVKLADSEKRFHWAFWVIVLCISIVGIEATIDYFTGGSHFNQGVERASGTTSIGDHPNSLAMYMASTIPMLIYLFSRFRKIPYRFLLFSLIAFCFLSLLITGSRSGVLTIVAVGFTYAWFSRHRIIYLAALIFLGIATWAALPNQYKERYSSIGGENMDASSRGRLNAWQAGVDMFLEKPIWGVGPGVFAAAYLDRKGIWLYSHSLYVETLATTGLLGLVTWFYFMYQIIKMLGRIGRWRGSPQVKNSARIFTRANYAIIAGLLLAGVFGHILFRDTWYMLAALIVARYNTLPTEPEKIEV